MQLGYGNEGPNHRPKGGSVQSNPSQATPNRMQTTKRGAVENDLIQRHYQQNEPGAREALIESLLPLVQSIARRYEHRGEPLEDLVQAGCIGLVKAVDRFDPDRGVLLTTFAVPNIAGEIKRYFRDSTRTMRVPRDVQELRSKLTKTNDSLTVRLGRFPSVAELAEATGETLERVVEALQSSHAYRLDSLNETVGEDEELIGLIGNADENFARADTRLMLDSQLADLDRRDLQILHMRYTQDMTQSEIADQVGVSQMHVSRLIRRAVDQLRDGLSESAPHRA